jgi:two-component system response regulator VicR
MKLLVIEDDPDVLEVISLSVRMGLPQAQVLSASRGQRGIEVLKKESPDIVLLDLLLPDMSGFEVLSEVRSFSNVPLVVISVKGEEVDRVRGLELGADDYIVKPFSHMELLARLRTVLRRTKISEAAMPTTFERGGLFINFRSQEVKLHGREVNLTPTQYKLLCELAVNAGRTMSQKVLVEKVWGEEFLDGTNVVKVHVHRLRRKIGDNPKNPRTIITVPGKGYKFQVPE